jgi:hypothetical protein
MSLQSQNQIKKYALIQILAAVALSHGAPIDALDQWYSRGKSEIQVLQDVVFGNGLFVAVGAQTVVSQNGIDWEIIPNGISANRIAYGDGVFVAIKHDQKVHTSSDGRRWITRTVGNPDSINDVAFGKGRFVMVGTSGSIWVSSDTIAWEKQMVGTGRTLHNVEFAGDKFFALGDQIWASSDAVEWRNLEVPSFTYTGLAYGNGAFVAGASARIMISADGESWQLTDYAGGGAGEIIFAEGIFIMPGNSNTIWTSKDGRNWIGRSTPPTGFTLTINGLAYGHSTIVAVGPVDPGYIIQSSRFSDGAPNTLTGKNVFGILITGDPGRTFRIEATGDLNQQTGWSEVARIVLPKTPHLWIDEDSPKNERRFYRAVLLP